MHSPVRRTRADVRVRILPSALVGLSVVMLAAGCQFPGTGSSGGASGSGTITVAVVPGIDNAPLDVARQDGLFQQHGLNVIIKSYDTFSDEFQALTDGQVQIADGDYTGFFYQQATAHAPLQLIADGYDAASNSVAILTLPTSKITTPQDLENQAVATPSTAIPMTAFSSTGFTAVPFNIQTLAAEEVLQNDGVSPSSVGWSPVPEQDEIGELSSGQVAAILVTEPYILQAEEQLGAVEVVDASSGVTSGLPLSGYFSLDRYASANPSDVQAFQTALDQAQADCAQRGTVQTVISSLPGMSADAAALVTVGTYPTSVNLSQVQRVAGLMYDSGMINTAVTVNAGTSG
jgi:NitT/TauT family transport system substrate-binding protein